MTDRPETDGPETDRDGRVGGATDVIAALTEEFRQGMPARVARIREGVVAWRDRGEAGGLDDRRNVHNVYRCLYRKY